MGFFDDRSCPECGAAVKESRFQGEATVTVERWCVNCDWHECVVEER